MREIWNYIDYIICTHTLCRDTISSLLLLSFKKLSNPALSSILTSDMSTDSRSAPSDGCRDCRNFRAALSLSFSSYTEMNDKDTLKSSQILQTRTILENHLHARAKQNACLCCWEVPLYTTIIYRYL